MKIFKLTVMIICLTLMFSLAKAQFTGGDGKGDFMSESISDIPLPVMPVKVTANFTIGNAYPNPFNPQTVVPVNMALDADIQAVLYDLNGHETHELYHGTLSVGSHDLKIDGSSLATGIYFVHVRINDAVHVQKIALIK